MGVPDDEQLAYATAQGRVIFTFNTRDYAVLHTEYLSKQQTHAGIIVSDQVQVGLLCAAVTKAARWQVSRRNAKLVGVFE